MLKKIKWFRGEKDFSKKILKNLVWKMFTVFILTLTASVSFIAYAAFTEPTSAPGDSIQDFAQNILGANNANNSFDSSSVAANADGSVVERLEYLAGLLHLPTAANVKLGESFGVNDAGTLTPVSGATTYSLDAVASDVATGKYFFGLNDDGDWVPTTGTSSVFTGYANQKNGIWDDWKGSGNSTNQGLAYAYANSLDQNEEETSWDSYSDANLNSATIASGSVKKDTRTGLYWSDCYSAVSGDTSCDTIANNSFTLNGVIADADDGLDAEDGVAVNFCEALSLDSNGDGTDETDWYLPSQKELMQAYIDGSANNITNPAYYFWSSTEYSNSSSSAWYVYLNYGYTNNTTKSTSSNCARCVRR